MIPVMQTICNCQTGNCMQACVASIFELPLEAVPNFMMGGNDHFDTHLKKWCDSIGVVAIDIAFNDQDAKANIFDCYTTAHVKDGPKDLWHAVVWFNDKLVHDPYPGGITFDSEPTLFTVFIIKNPSKYIKDLPGGVRLNQCSLTRLLYPSNFLLLFRGFSLL